MRLAGQNWLSVGSWESRYEKCSTNVGDDVVVHRFPNSGTAAQELSLTEDVLSPWPKQVLSRPLYSFSAGKVFTRVPEGSW